MPDTMASELPDPSSRQRWMAQLALATRALAGRKGRPVPRSEIDDMWSR